MLRINRTVQFLFSLGTVIIIMVSTLVLCARFHLDAHLKYLIIKNLHSCSLRVSTMGLKQSMNWQKCVQLGMLNKWTCKIKYQSAFAITIMLVLTSDILNFCTYWVQNSINYNRFYLFAKFKKLMLNNIFWRTICHNLKSTWI